MRVAGAPYVVSSSGTSVVRSIGEAGDGKSGGHDVAVVAQPLGEHSGAGGDDRMLFAVGAHGADAGTAGDELPLVDRVGTGEDALGRRDDDLHLRDVLALPV